MSAFDLFVCLCQHPNHTLYLCFLEYSPSGNGCHNDDEHLHSLGSSDKHWSMLKYWPHFGISCVTPYQHHKHSTNTGSRRIHSPPTQIIIDYSRGLYRHSFPADRHHCCYYKQNSSNSSPFF